MHEKTVSHRDVSGILGFGAVVEEFFVVTDTVSDSNSLAVFSNSSKNAANVDPPYLASSDWNTSLLNIILFTSVHILSSFFFVYCFVISFNNAEDRCSNCNGEL